jgi:peptidoglycan hydrolase-like protein with peptidoglycan-binding domain
MKIYQTAAVLLSLGSLAALPACSSMGIHMPGSQTSSAAPMATPEMSPDMVKQVQTGLQQQGVYQGNIDGVWGPATMHAVQSYQQKHNLTANGQLDEPTLKSLNIMNDTTANSMAPASSGTTAAPPAPPPAPSVSAPPATAAPPPPPPAATNQ